MPHRRPATSAVALVAATVTAVSAFLVGCDPDGGADRDSAPSRPATTLGAVDWAEQALPRSPGRPGRPTVRDVVRCGGRWYVVGGVLLDRPTEDQDSRPAVWVGDDRGRWRPLPVRTTTFWGARAVLQSAGCSRGRLAVVGSRSGGAHGNPRVTTFRVAADGALVDVQAVVTQFGGSEAVNVGVVSGGDAGWLIAGNRASGPAVWVTDDPREFHRVEGEPGLTGDGETASSAHDGAQADDGWVLVGAAAAADDALDREPVAWSSADGLAWRAEDVPAADEWEDLQRATTLTDGRVLAAGVRGERFGTWVRDASGTWHPADRFGELPERWTSAPYVASLTALPDGGVVATVSTGARLEVWRGDPAGSWERLAAPVTPDTGGDHSLAIAAADGRLLLVADDGSGGRAWLGPDEG